MKKMLTTALIGLALAGCSYDKAMLGYPNERYTEQREENVAVYYNGKISDKCTQRSVVVTDVNGEIQDIVDNLREEAGEIGANMVDINQINFKSGFFTSGQYVIATFYVCKP